MITHDEDVRAIMRRARRRPLWTQQPTNEVSLGRRDIERMIPHRDPILLVDAIDAVDLTAEALRARRRVDPRDPVFTGHFPENPVYPGALLVESMGQAALCLHHLLETGRTFVGDDDEIQPVRLLKVHHAAFLAECRPGDHLTLLCKRLLSDGLCMVCATQVLRDGEIAAFAILEVYLVEND